MANNFTELTRKKMDAVVQIYAEGFAGEEVKSILNPRLGDLKDWSGSGFFVDTSYGEGIIITNAHVAKNAKSLEIMTMLTSEETFQVEVVGLVKNQEPDIAVLKLKEGELERLKSMVSSQNKSIPHLSLRKNLGVTRGTEIKAIGYPMGMTEPNITGGEITNFMSGERMIAEKYVTDAAINPGNSGGPAIDENGEVIGINTSIYQDAENIGFITPSTFIDIILTNIFENKSVHFSDIGGSFQKNSPEAAKALKMRNTTGLIVRSLDREGFLESAQVKLEDVILSLTYENPQGETVTDQIDRHGILISEDHYHRRNIFDVFKLTPLGSNISLEVWRNGETITLNGKARCLKLRNIESNPIIEEREFIDAWGLTIQVLSFEILESFNLTDTYWFYQILEKFNSEKTRLVVTHVEKDSPAYHQEWRPGEIIEKIDGTSLEGLSHLLEILKEKRDLYKLTSESGTLGHFKGSSLKKNLKLLNPTYFLK